MSGPIPPAVRLEFRDRIALLSLSRPDRNNTMDLAFGSEFLAAALAIDASNARAVVLSGEGRNFCFGGDLRGMVASAAEVSAYLAELTANLHRGMAHLAAQAAPLIAAVHGFAAGAGLGLVLMADIVIAARSARFTPAYTAVGLTPDAGCSFLLPRVIGAKRAMEMLLTNRILDAAEALEWGLVNRIVEDGELSQAAFELATRLAAGPIGAHGVVKRLLSESQPGFAAQMAREGREISLQAGSAEAAEGISAFLAKRPPRF